MKTGSFQKGDRVRFKGGVDTFVVWDAPDDDIMLAWEKTGRLFAADYRLLEHVPTVELRETSLTTTSYNCRNCGQPVTLRGDEKHDCTEFKDTAERAKKRHCWPSDSIAGVYEGGFQNGVDWALRRAREELVEWLECTGVLAKGTSYYAECLACVDDVVSGDSTS